MTTAIRNELTYRVLISTAAGYAKYIEEEDAKLLKFWGSVYGQGDIQAWAKSQIEEIVERASKLSLDFDQLTSAQSAVAQHVERLARVGYRFSNAPSAGGSRINTPQERTLL
jgi:hypothetical protein